MNKKMLIGIIAVIVIIIAAATAYLTTRPMALDGSGSNTTTVDDQNSSEVSIDTSQITEMPIESIAYTDNGFEPTSLTVKKGTAVTVTNNSSMNLTFSSADHPTHQENPELNTSTIKPGDSKTVMITKPGTWGYHNHDSAQHTGQIIVTE